MEQVYVTTDYEIFKKLKGNRPVEEPHVQELIRKIKNNHPVDTIVFVNEKMEVLDGQHRVEAFRRLGLPVKYKVCYGMTIKDVILMNSTQQPWTIGNFVGSFRDQDFGCYHAFNALYEKFPELTTNTLLSVVGSYAPVKQGLNKAKAALKSGTLYYPFDREEELFAELSFLSKFAFVRQLKHGRSDTFYKAISACYHCDNIDNDKLLKRMEELASRMASYNTFRECLQAIEDIYNLRARNHIYLTTDVLKMIREAEKAKTLLSFEEVDEEDGATNGEQDCE